MQDHPPLRVADLAPNDANPFEIRPDPGRLGRLAAELGLKSLRKLRFAGGIRAKGSDDWQLEARLGATIVQLCVVTLAPVTTRIDIDVSRSFLARWEEPSEEETEMHADDNIERLGSHIDLMAVMSEALALALPLYPRAPGADLGQAVFTRPGQTPMSDEAAKPFAGLAGLRDALDQMPEDAPDKDA